MGKNSEKRLGKASFRRSDSKPLTLFADVINPIWHTERNAPYTPEDFSSGQSTLLWWRCEKSHEYQSSPANIIQGQRCPFCSNRRVLKGFNDLESQEPRVASHWDAQNNELDPTEVISTSAKPAFWLCDKGHSFERPIREMVESTSCPYCTNRQVLKGFNDLQHVFPDIASELVASDDHSGQADQILAVSTKKLRWRCKQGHTWEAPVRARTKGHGCPYCKKRFLDSATNSLQALYPKLAKEWDLVKNSPIKPCEVFDGGAKNYWWKCEFGHSWKSSIARRVSGRGCHVCANRRVLPGFNDLATKRPDLAQEWDYSKNTKLATDVLFGTNQKFWWLCPKGHSYQSSPSKRINESTGCPYCANKLILKGFNDLASQRPVLASRWSESNPRSPSEVYAQSHATFTFECHLGHEWRVQPATISNEGYCPTCANTLMEIGFNDIPSRFPEMAATFAADLNQGIDLRTVDPRSKSKLVWRCGLGHVWAVSPASRVNGQGCPYCANKRVLEGFNDLSHKFPLVAAEWDIEKNEKSPQAVNYASNSIYWWKCSLGHSYRQAVSNKTGKNYGCPYCSRKQLLQGFNDLETTHPQLALEWHPTKNGTLSPRDVLAGTAKKVWWRCNQGHEWPALPFPRTKGVGCPTCNKGGFDPSKPGYVYFIRHVELQARKVGITNIDSPRLSNFKSAGWEEIHLFYSKDGNRTRSVETEFFRWLRKDLGVRRFLSEEAMYPLFGASETFEMHEPPDFAVVRKLTSLHDDYA